MYVIKMSTNNLRPFFIASTMDVCSDENFIFLIILIVGNKQEKVMCTCVM
jgi:hypothetical protein